MACPPRAAVIDGVNEFPVFLRIFIVGVFSFVSGLAGTNAVLVFSADCGVDIEDCDSSEILKIGSSASETLSSAIFFLRSIEQF